MRYGKNLQNNTSYKLLNKFISIMVGALFLLNCSVGFCQQPSVVLVGQNQPAPFSGMLLSKEAAAQIIAQTQQKVDLERADCKLRMGQLEARMQKEIDICAVDLRAQIVKFEAENIKLQLAVEKANKSKWTWSIVAALTGIVAGGVTAKILWK